MAERGSRQGQCSRVCALLLLLLLAGVALFISPATPILLATLVLISPYIFVHFSSKRQSLFIIWGQTPLPAAAPPFPPACQAITLPPCPARTRAHPPPPALLAVSLRPRVLPSLLSVGLVVAFIIDASLLRVRCYSSSAAAPPYMKLPLLCSCSYCSSPAAGKLRVQCCS